MVVNNDMIMTWLFRLLLTVVLLLALAQYGWNQGSYIGLTISSGYFVNSEKPRFSGNGYPNQFLLQLGALLKVDINERISLEISPVYYQRKERFNCIYFPDGTEPLRNLNPLINHPVYICDSNSDTKIQYLDIPLNVYYPIKKNEKFKLLVGFGIGPQIQLRRETVITDKLTGEIQSAVSYDNNTSFVLSWKTSKALFCLEKSVTSKILLSSRVEFKIDELLFRNNTIMLGVYSAYKL